MIQTNIFVFWSREGKKILEGKIKRQIGKQREKSEAKSFITLGSSFFLNYHVFLLWASMKHIKVVLLHILKILNNIRFKCLYISGSVHVKMKYRYHGSLKIYFTSHIYAFQRISPIQIQEFLNKEINIINC